VWRGGVGGTQAVLVVLQGGWQGQGMCCDNADEMQSSAQRGHMAYMYHRVGTIRWVRLTYCSSISSMDCCASSECDQYSNPELIRPKMNIPPLCLVLEGPTRTASSTSSLMALNHDATFEQAQSLSWCFLVMTEVMSSTVGSGCVIWLDWRCYCFCLCFCFCCLQYKAQQCQMPLYSSENHQDSIR